MSIGGATRGPMQAMMVKRKLISSLVKCPLCHKLVRNATTIIECLHTFCRKCIFYKLTDEADCCPICNTGLGCIPVEKLRPDHTLHNIRTKIFPYKKRKVNAPEFLPLLPARRKERSLSSLVVNTPRIGTQAGLTGRRTRAVTRRASTLNGVSLVLEEPVKKDGDNNEHLAENSSSPEACSKMVHSKRWNSSYAEASNHTTSNETENGRESFINKSELWKPLNCLVEVANRTNGLKSSLQSPVIKAEQTNGVYSDSHFHKPKIQEHPSKSKIQYDKNNNVPTFPVTFKARKLHGLSRKRKEPRSSAQAVLDARDAASERRISPVWLSLVSSSDQKGDTPLPQISTSYLRIKEGNLPVTFLQKYLVKKLNLASESEVEISCRGLPVNPTFSLHDLTEQWLLQGPSQRVQASVGTSAKEFVMVVTYSRKSLTS